MRKKTAAILFFLVLIFASAMAAHAEWTAERYRTVHAVLTCADSLLDSTSVQSFERLYDSNKTAHGFLLDIRTLSGDSIPRLADVLSKFSDKPIVFLMDTERFHDPQLARFVKGRQDAQIERSGNLDKAKQRIERLVTRRRMLREDAMEMMRKR